MNARHTTRRKTTPRVRDGEVQKKNRWAWTPDADAALLTGGQLVVEARAPGVGRRHVVTPIDVRRFLRCMPDTDSHIEGLRAIVLGNDDGAMGVYDSRGIITLCSWANDLMCEWEPDFVGDHLLTLLRLGVPIDDIQDEDAPVTVYFDERSARAFQLVHVLLHELGHHRDRMAARNRGEAFAESWAIDMEARVWPRYKEWFGRPGLVRVETSVRGQANAC
jgi:hypothetical protein